MKLARRLPQASRRRWLPRSGPGRHSASQLGPFLCWAVVFADIGTSVYYTPGILYSQVGLLAGLFVTMTVLVFLLLTFKYAEVCVRFPQGGGVVTVAAQALHPWAGVVGGMFILVDYFLTAAISADSGLHYLSAMFQGIAALVVPLAVLVIALLGLLNWWGIKESAEVSAVAASVAFVVDIVILVAIVMNVPMHAIGQAFVLLFSIPLRPTILLTGFAGSFLAFSGLESISQLSPAMRAPRQRTVGIALGLVFVTVALTSPLLTILSTTLLTACTPKFVVCSVQVWHARLAAHSLVPNPNRFISELAAVAGGSGFGRMLEITTAIAASALLVFASNTAIIGAYHVVVALTRMRYLPRSLARPSKWRGTPTVAIFLVTMIPILVLLAVRGDAITLGDMYAFGLLGAFSLTCLSVDVIRWGERRRAPSLQEDVQHDARARRPTGGLPQPVHPNGRRTPNALGVNWSTLNFCLGILTTILVLVAWLTNLKTKPLATAFGGSITLLGVAISIIYDRYQRSKDQLPVFPMLILHRIAHSLLVVLPADAHHQRQLVTAACDSSQGRSLVFLFLGSPSSQRIQLLQIDDPYLADDQAQYAFSQAALLCHSKRVKPTHFVYSVDGRTAVAHMRRTIRPDLVLAEADGDQQGVASGRQEAVSIQTIDGVRIAFCGLGSPDAQV